MSSGFVFLAFSLFSLCCTKLTMKNKKLFCWLFLLVETPVCMFCHNSSNCVVLPEAATEDECEDTPICLLPGGVIVWDMSEVKHFLFIFFFFICFCFLCMKFWHTPFPPSHSHSLLTSFLSLLWCSSLNVMLSKVALNNVGARNVPIKKLVRKTLGSVKILIQFSKVFR